MICCSIYVLFFDCFNCSENVNFLFFFEDGKLQGEIIEILERAADAAMVEYEAKLVLDQAKVFCCSLSVLKFLKFSIHKQLTTIHQSMKGNHWAVHIADPSQPLAFVKPGDLNGGDAGDVVLLQLVPRADGNRQVELLYMNLFLIAFGLVFNVNQLM